ncbi:cell growth regulator with EF hand domain protein 1-like [Denticeps clupeoides]|uniref:EF-hand domain-containing protein n=1 Tax=Denticeps clupeoides TaxID=299321 RepID=A0AAY4CZG1_9TELE|nr:cell growth regulator with EF hand domain protein 1-like [Denticeps clupeoides]
MNAGRSATMEADVGAASRGLPARLCRTAALLCLLLLPEISLCAPQVHDSARSESAVVIEPHSLVNPFGTDDNSRKLLQSFIKLNMKDEQASPGVNTWEQEIFFLFSLYDYDKSGHLDGLEVMKLLSDFLSHYSQLPESNDRVVSLVDYLLQTHDMNQDGLLAPSELLSPPIQSHYNEPGADSKEQVISHETEPGDNVSQNQLETDTAQENDVPVGNTELHQDVNDMNEQKGLVEKTAEEKNQEQLQDPPEENIMVEEQQITQQDLQNEMPEGNAVIPEHTIHEGQPEM